MTDYKKEKHSVEWNKLRSNLMPVILRDLSPNHPFNPEHLWNEEKLQIKIKQEQKVINDTNTTINHNDKQKKKKKEIPLKKADLIRLEIKKQNEIKKTKKDQEKLSNAHIVSLIDMKMDTFSGRLKQLYELLVVFLKKKEYIDAIDTFWEIQDLNNLNINKENKNEIQDIHKKYNKYSEKVFNYLEKIAKKKAKKKKDEIDNNNIVNYKISSEDSDIDYNFDDNFINDNKIYKYSNLISYQLTAMSDRLSPLNLHHNSSSAKLKLDDWQKNVLTYIDNKESVVVCAPTSSGKTVLSTYSSVIGGKVLFLVPTEPLVWQVAAMFQALLKGRVSLISDHVNYLPQDFQIMVGTPKAIESHLTSPSHIPSTVNYLSEITYAVYDEVHDLNGKNEGPFLERIIIKLSYYNIPFLALSATINNSKEIYNWFSKVYNNPTNQMKDSSRQIKAKPKMKIHLVEYSGRFINLQRYIYKPITDATKNHLQILHPVTAMDYEYVLNDLNNESLPFTSKDSFYLYKKMRQYYSSIDAEDRDIINQSSPAMYFKYHLFLNTNEAKDNTKLITDEKKKKNKDERKSKKDKTEAKDDTLFIDNILCTRLSLIETKNYELILKDNLKKLSKKYPLQTKELLNDFLKKVEIYKSIDDKDEPTSTNHQDDSYHANSTTNEDRQNNTNTIEEDNFNIYDLIMECSEANFCPLIAFHLNNIKCRYYFNQLLLNLEKKEREKYPNYQQNLIKEQTKKEAENKKAMKKLNSTTSNKKELEELERDDEMERGDSVVDIFMPHPDFVLTSQNARLSYLEVNDIKKSLKQELIKHNQNTASLSQVGSADIGVDSQYGDGHAFIRGLRRGIGLYNNNLPSSYLIVVQQLAQNGRLAVVLSDSSLAYGVNMPFRTTIFLPHDIKTINLSEEQPIDDEDVKKADQLDSLMAQQMAGRAGRRGLDRQGNIIFVGMPFQKVKILMRGILPDVTGQETAYPTIALEYFLTDQSTPQDSYSILKRITTNSLREYHFNNKRNQTSDTIITKVTSEYLEKSLSWMKGFGIIGKEFNFTNNTGMNEALLFDKQIIKFLYETRDNTKESLLIFSILPLLYTVFERKQGENVAVQLAFFNIFLRIVSRKEIDANGNENNDNTNDMNTLVAFKDQKEIWDKITVILKEYNKKILSLNMPTFFLVSLEKPLDNEVWKTILNNQITLNNNNSNNSNNYTIITLKKRLYHIGDQLRRMHNILQHDTKYFHLEILFRKCFRRIKWILMDAEV